MKYIPLLLITLLTACNNVYMPTHANIIAVCDSLGEETHDPALMPTWPEVAGIDSDCVGGRNNTELAEMPVGYDTIIYALGTNNITQTTTEEYEVQLQYHFSTTDSNIVCVLPDQIVYDNRGMGAKASEIRQVMFDNCPKVIEPRDHGYLFRAKDGIHGIPDDHYNLGTSFGEMIAKGELIHVNNN